MSLFSRPDSPPPRQPSPEFVPAPLPSPHLRPRLRIPSSNSQQSVNSHDPQSPPGLYPGPRYILAPKPLLSVRSHDHLHERGYSVHSDPGERRRTRSTLSMSPPTTPRSASLPLPSNSSNTRHEQQRSPFSSPYHSPPPSPMVSSPPPPVPPIPAFALAHTGRSHTKHALRSQPSQSSIRFSHFESTSCVSEPSSPIPRKQCRSPPAPDKHRSLGMTCLRFFSLRNPNQRSSRPTVA